MSFSFFSLFRAMTMFSLSVFLPCHGHLHNFQDRLEETADFILALTFFGYSIIS